MAGRIVTDRDRARAVGNALRTHGRLRITKGQANAIRCGMGIHGWALMSPSMFSIYDYRQCERCAKTQRRTSPWGKWKDVI